MLKIVKLIQISELCEVENWILNQEVMKIKGKRQMECGEIWNEV